MSPGGQPLFIGESSVSLTDAGRYVFGRGLGPGIRYGDGLLERADASRKAFLNVLSDGRPIYGVTTGFGDSCHRRIDAGQSEQLQENLVRYLSCGTGREMPKDASRATLLFRLISLSRGLSAVSSELLERMRLFLERDWIPVILREGSLGASGDLIPLAYIARPFIGEGEVDTPDGRRHAGELLAEHGIPPYRLKPKEGLALVNRTSAMAGLILVNWNYARFQVDLATLATVWLCQAMGGRPEAFGRLVNERAKSHAGQARVARRVARLLEEERYVAPPDSDGRIQDRYSLRCTPQVLGPVEDTLDLVRRWLDYEINGVSDNPLVSPEGELAMGGNFYGGYLSQGMDYLKISLGHVADLTDRQLALVIDEKSNRGLPANLAAWDRLPAEQRYLHHGLKGLHQAVSAITSEILPRTVPSGIFSRSSESHNQDKVSLGMSAATSGADIIESLFTIQTMHMICLAQALELRGIRPVGEMSRAVFGLVREHVPFVERDMPLDRGVRELTARLQRLARQEGGLFHETT